MGKFEAMSIVVNKGDKRNYIVVHDSGEYTLLQRADKECRIDGACVVAWGMCEVEEGSHIVEWSQGHYYNIGDPIENLKAAMDYYMSRVEI